MKWEEHLKTWIRKNIFFFGYIAVALLGIFLRYSYIPMLSADMEFLNSAWFDAIKEGGMGAVLNPKLQYNYSPLHLYIWTLAANLLGSFDTVIALKLVSLMMETVLLLACYGIITHLTQNHLKRFLGFCVLAVNPVLLWNAAGWGQTDTGFAGMCVLAVLFLLNEKPVLGLSALGIALAFKLQAIFILPLFMYAWFQGPKKFSVFWFFLVPAIWVCSGIPMMSTGASPLYAVQVYLGQTGIYNKITFNYPNLYALMSDAVGRKPMLDGMISRTGTAMLIVLLGSLAVWMLYKNVSLKEKSTLLK